MANEDKPAGLIDPPVNGLSPVTEIHKWIAELEHLPDSPQKAAALDEAYSWLRVRE